MQSSELSQLLEDSRITRIDKNSKNEIFQKTSNEQKSRILRNVIFKGLLPIPLAIWGTSFFFKKYATNYKRLPKLVSGGVTALLLFRFMSVYRTELFKTGLENLDSLSPEVQEKLLALAKIRADLKPFQKETI